MDTVKEFYEFLHSKTHGQQKIILMNLYTRLETAVEVEEELPF